METTVKTMEETNEIVKMSMKNYLVKTQKHLFMQGVDKHEYIIKIVSKGNKIYTIRFDINLKLVDIVISDIDRYIKIWDKNAKNVMKKSLFPDYEMTKTIKHFKKIRTKIDIIQNYIENSDTILLKEIQQIDAGVKIYNN